MKRLITILMALVLSAGAGSVLAKDKAKDKDSDKNQAKAEKYLAKYEESGKDGYLEKAQKYLAKAGDDDDDDDDDDKDRNGNGYGHCKANGKGHHKDQHNGWNDDDDCDHDDDKDRKGNGYGHCKNKGKGHHKGKHDGWDHDDCDDDNPPPPPPVCVAAAGPFDPVPFPGTYTVTYNYAVNQSALVSVPGIVQLTYSGQLCSADGLSTPDNSFYTSTETLFVNATLSYNDGEQDFSQAVAITVNCVVDTVDVAPKTTLANGDFYYAFEVNKVCSPGPVDPLEN